MPRRSRNTNPSFITTFSCHHFISCHRPFSVYASRYAISSPYMIRIMSRKQQAYPFNESWVTAGLCALPYTSRNDTDNCHLSEFRPERNFGRTKPGSWASTGYLRREERRLLQYWFRPARVNAPPSNLNCICFALSLGQPHYRCESASGQETTPLLYSRFCVFLSWPNNS